MRYTACNSPVANSVGTFRPTDDLGTRSVTAGVVSVEYHRALREHLGIFRSFDLEFPGRSSGGSKAKHSS